MDTSSAPNAARVQVAISDPVSADIQAICGAIQASMVFGSTTQGQRVVQMILDGTLKLEDAITKALSDIRGVFAK